MSQGILLDTCALIWTVNGSDLSESAIKKINASAGNGALFVNPMSAWEVGMLSSKGRLTLSMSVRRWFERIADNPAFQLAELSHGILINSTALPGSPPNDPVDRIMLAMARENDLELMTRDREILNYAGEGHARAISC